MKLKYLILAVLILILLASFAYREMAEGDSPPPDSNEAEAEAEADSNVAQESSSFSFDGFKNEPEMVNSPFPTMDPSKIVAGLNKDMCKDTKVFCKKPETKLAMAGRTFVFPGGFFGNKSCTQIFDDVCKQLK